MSYGKTAKNKKTKTDESKSKSKAKAKAKKKKKNTKDDKRHTMEIRENKKEKNEKDNKKSRYPKDKPKLKSKIKSKSNSHHPTLIRKKHDTSNKSSSSPYSISRSRSKGCYDERLEWASSGSSRGSWGSSGSGLMWNWTDNHTHKNANNELIDKNRSRTRRRKDKVPL